MTHENAGQSGAQDLKLYSVAFSTWNGSFSGLDHHNVLAVGSGAEDALGRTKETVSQDAQDFKAVEIDHVMGCKIVTLDEAASMAMQAETVRLTLVNGRRSCPLSLPAADEHLERAKKVLDVEDFAQASITDVKFSSPHLADLLPLGAASVEDINRFALCLEEMEQENGELMKFCAILEVEQPETFAEALHIAIALDDYEQVPEAPDAYGKQVLRRIGADDEVIDTIDGYMDFARLGEDAMVEDGVRRTGFGLVRRLSEPFPPEPEFRQTLL